MLCGEILMLTWGVKTAQKPTRILWLKEEIGFMWSWCKGDLCLPSTERFGSTLRAEAAGLCSRYRTVSAGLTLGNSTHSGMKVTFALSLLNVVGLKGESSLCEGQVVFFYDNQCFQMYPAFEINSLFGFFDFLVQFLSPHLCDSGLCLFSTSSFCISLVKRNAPALVLWKQPCYHVGGMSCGHPRFGCCWSDSIHRPGEVPC